MKNTDKRSTSNLKKAFSPARISAAFFILFFLVSVIAAGLINRANAGAVPLAESLGYDLVEINTDKTEEPLAIIVQRDSVSKEETVEIAKEWKKDKKQAVVVFATTNTAFPETSAEYNEDVEYKITITEDKMETIEFDVYKDSQPELIEHQNWDLSDNVLDLVTGQVTIKIEMDNNWEEGIVLSAAQALSQQILASNQESGVSSVFFEINVGNQLYLYDSEHFYTIGKYQVSDI